jgi:hypothetical protein
MATTQVAYALLLLVVLPYCIQGSVQLAGDGDGHQVVLKKNECNRN